MTRPAPVVVATASSPVEAQIWVDMLRDEGILAASFPIGDHGAFGGGSILPPHVRVLVGRADFARARNVIAESGGASALAPVPLAGVANASRMGIALWIAVAGALALLGGFVFSVVR